MPTLVGFGLATLALLLFGVYMVPRKLTGLRDIPFSLTMCLGVVVSTTLINLVAHGQPLGPAPSRAQPATIAKEPGSPGLGTPGKDDGESGPGEASRLDSRRPENR